MRLFGAFARVPHRKIQTSSEVPYSSHQDSDGEDDTGAIINNADSSKADRLIIVVSERWIRLSSNKIDSCNPCHSARITERSSLPGFQLTLISPI